MFFPAMRALWRDGCVVAMLQVYARGGVWGLKLICWGLFIALSPWFSGEIFGVGGFLWRFSGLLKRFSIPSNWLGLNCSSNGGFGDVLAVCPVLSVSLEAEGDRILLPEEGVRWH